MTKDTAVANICSSYSEAEWSIGRRTDKRPNYAYHISIAFEVDNEWIDIVLLLGMNETFTSFQSLYTLTLSSEV